MFWDRLLQDTPPELDEVDRELLTLARAGDFDQRVAFVLLRSCVAIARGGTPAMKRNLKAALVHWISNSGYGDVSDRVVQDDLPMTCYALMGQRLSWREAAILVGGNPNDYSAYSRLLERLVEECARTWRETFGEEREQPFEVVANAT